MIYFFLKRDGINVDLYKLRENEETPPVYKGKIATHSWDGVSNSYEIRVAFDGEIIKEIEYMNNLFLNIDRIILVDDNFEIDKEFEKIDNLYYLYFDRILFYKIKNHKISSFFSSKFDIENGVIRILKCKIKISRGHIFFVEYPFQGSKVKSINYFYIKIELFLKNIEKILKQLKKLG